MSILSQFIKSIHPSTILDLLFKSMDTKQKDSLKSNLEIVQLAILIAAQAAPDDQNVIKSFTIISDLKNQLG